MFRFRGEVEVPSDIEFIGGGANVLRYDHVVETAAELENLNIGSMTASCAILLNWKDSTKTLADKIQIPPANDVCLIIVGKAGPYATILKGASNKPVFETQSTNWTSENTLIFEKFQIESNSDLCGDFGFCRFFFTQVKFKGTSNNNAKMTIFGGSGAVAHTGSLDNCVWHTEGGVTTNYMCRLWAEGCLVTNPMFLLAGVDVAGCFEFLGTDIRVVGTTVHQWSGRDITIAVFYCGHNECNITIMGLYMAVSSGTATCAWVYQLLDPTAADSRFWVGGCIRTVEENAGKIKDAFTDARDYAAYILVWV